MSAVSGMCGSSSGPAVARFADDRQTYGDPAPARKTFAACPIVAGERDPGFAGPPPGS
jgi:hypothetical protein